MESPNVAVKDLLRLMPHLEIAHHIPGRIRLRILLSGLGILRGVNIEDIILSIPGVLGMRIDAATQSVVIEYDQEQLPFELLERVKQLTHKPELVPDFAARLQALWNQ